MTSYRNIYAEAIRNHRRFGGKRTIKDKCRGGVSKGRKGGMAVLEHWPVSTSRHVVVGKGVRR